MTRRRGTHQCELAIVATLLVAACSSSSPTTTAPPPPPPPPPSVASVIVQPVADTVLVGGTAQLTATPKDAGGNALSGQTVVWSSGNAAVATVSTSGLITGVAVGGPVTVSATSGGVVGTAVVTVNPSPVSIVTVTPVTASLVVGGTMQFAATTKDGNGNPLGGRSYSWTTSNGAIATVSTAGLVTAVAAGGPVTITATSQGTSGAASVTVITAAAAAAGQVTVALDSAQSTFLRFAAQTGGNPAQALALTATAIRTSPGVASVTLVDSTDLVVQTASGAQTEFSFDQRGADGLSLSRGGRATSGAIHLASFGRAMRTITNKNVLICAPNFSHQYPSGALAPILDTIAASGLGATVSILTDNNCGYFTVSTFPNYGLVILDTHGTPDSFEMGDTLALPAAPPANFDLQSAIDAQLGPGATQLINNQDLRLDVITTIPNGTSNWWSGPPAAVTVYRVSVTSKYIADMMPSLAGTAIFANMCYSGWQGNTPDSTSGIATAFMAKNPQMYWGYVRSDGSSAQVSNQFARDMEDSLVHALFIDEDSLQIANLQNHQTEFADPASTSNPVYFRALVPVRAVAYDWCSVPLVDPRDMQSYTSVCEGVYRWMQQNLNYAGGGSFCYNGDNTNCMLYGGLYPPSSALAPGLCPAHWHVPSLAEYDDLILKLGGENAAGGKMKEALSGHWKFPNTGATNSSGFTALPGGYYDYGTGLYQEISDEAVLGTSTQITDSYFSIVLQYVDATAIPEGNGNYGTSIRCLHDYR